ncbi:hypothetical protein [Raoultella ornithinolytica]|uniref:hypothetical protein n=1 Tax=Raoultella ornithinolytica TaxID=54291 RepID=UPI0038901A30
MTSKLTITREQATDKEIQMLIDSHENGTAMFLRVDAYYLMAKELQECRKAELDSKPVAWTDEEELRDANESGSGYLFGIGHDANKFADPRRQIMLYLHAQQPVVPDDVLDALQKVARIRLDLNGFDGDRRGIADCLCDAEEALIEVVNRRAAMLQGAENAESRCGIQTAPALDSFKKNSESRCGNSPVIPDGYVMVPMRLTAENGAKGALAGEFSETKFVNCSECFGDDECETCDGSGRIEITVPVSWTNIKEIWAKGVEHFAAAPQEVQGE